MKIPSNDAFLFQNKENEILFGPPPPEGAGIRTVVNKATHTCARLYQQPESWIFTMFTRSILSDMAR